MDRQKLVSNLERDEGIRLKVYFDSLGIPTIGIGRNLRDKGISREEAYHLLDNDLVEVVSNLDQYLPWWSGLDDARQRVLANMDFNLGIKRLLGFKNTLKFIQSGQFDQAASGMMASLWANQVGIRAKRLSDTMRTGNESP